MNIFNKLNIKYFSICLLYFIAFKAYTTISDDILNNTISYEKLENTFNQYDYNLDKIKNNSKKVPRIFINQLPKNFDQIKSINERKDLFIKILLPLVLKKNEEISNLRNKLIFLKNKSKLTKKEKIFLENIKNQYKVKDINNLLIKIDIIPVSIVLGQAIQETGWGISRFAINGNALFGEWTWNKRGIIPKNREKGLKHKIKTFNSLYNSVDSYINNLNQNLNYYKFRKERYKLKQNKKIRDEINLLNYLNKYSTDNKYIKNIKNIILYNGLLKFNETKLKNI